jgi:hypothetical protein
LRRRGLENMCVKGRKNANRSNTNLRNVIFFFQKCKGSRGGVLLVPPSSMPMSYLLSTRGRRFMPHRPHPQMNTGHMSTSRILSGCHYLLRPTLLEREAVLSRRSWTPFMR